MGLTARKPKLTADNLCFRLWFVNLNRSGKFSLESYFNALAHIHAPAHLLGLDSDALSNAMVASSVSTTGAMI